MDNRIDALARLERLHAQGVLTEAELEQQKHALNHVPPDDAKRPTWSEAWEEGREYGNSPQAGPAR